MANAKRTWFYALAGLIPFIPACDNSLETDKRQAEEKTIESYMASNSMAYTKSDGVYHVVVEPSYGYEVNAGDTVEFWYVAYTLAGPVFETNIESVAVEQKLSTDMRRLTPLRVVAGETGLVTGLKRGLLLTRLNQSSTIIFTSDLGFKGRIVGPVDAWSPLAYNVRVIYLNGRGIQAERRLISSMDLSGYTPHSTGLYYKYLTETSGTHPSGTSTVYGWYRVALPGGEVVEEAATPNAQISLSQVPLVAVKEGFALLAEGGSAELIAPSPLAYGKKGNGRVQPYQPVVISVRLDSIK